VDHSVDAHPPLLTEADARPAGGGGPGRTGGGPVARYGPTWEIAVTEPAILMAIRRPTPTAQEIVIAHSLAELDRKLASESRPGEVAVNFPTSSPAGTTDIRPSCPGVLEDTG
jgi:hypothetical protein